MNKLIKLNLRGDLGEKVGRAWEFNVKSVKEAIFALNSVTKNKFNNYFIQNDKLYAKYRVLINGRDFSSPVNEINEKNWEQINHSELMMAKQNIETIDIVPFLESSDSKILGIITLVVGVVLIATGVFSEAGFVVANQGLIIMAGVTLLAAGVFALLSRPPEFGKFKDPDKIGGSYLFGGPVNVIDEGGPVPVGYGRLLVGSQVISSAYKINNYQTFRE